MSVSFVVIIWYLGSFLFSFFLSPLLIRVLNKVEAWPKSSRKTTIYGMEAVEYNKIQTQKSDHKIPRMGGIVFVLTMLAALLSIYFIYNAAVVLLLAGIFFFVALIGLYDDLSETFSFHRNGLRFWLKTLLVFIAGVVFSGALYFLFGFDTVTLGIVKTVDLNAGLFLPLIAGLWIAGWFTSSPIDGIDSLAATVLQVAFISLGIMFALDGDGWVIYSSIAFAAAGSLTAFHWFNTTPARFYFTEVGMSSALVLFAALAYISGVSGEEGIAFSLFPGIMLLVTISTTILQMLYRVIFKRKLFLVTPIHHTFQTNGMPNASIVNKYLIVSIVFAMFGLALVS